jgi:hypothetical protein
MSALPAQEVRVERLSMWQLELLNGEMRGPPSILALACFGCTNERKEIHVRTL